MHERTISSLLRNLGSAHQIIVITGPRNSGKAALAKEVFPQLPYVSFGNLNTGVQNNADLKNLIANYPEGALFDKAQNISQIAHDLEKILESSPEKGLYILVADQNPNVHIGVAQPLSSRIGLLTMLPPSLEEMGKLNTLDIETLNPEILKGNNPDLLASNSNLKVFNDYIGSIATMYPKYIKGKEEIAKFRMLGTLCALGIASSFKLSTLAKEVHLSPSRVRQWINILKANYVLFFLKPFHQKSSKPYVKMSKLYFYDTGLACAFLGIRNETELRNSKSYHALFKNIIILEIMKKCINQGLDAAFYFWQERRGRKIAFLAQLDNKLHIIDIKPDPILQNDYLHQLWYCIDLCKTIPDISIMGYLIYTGQNSGKHLNITVLPLNKIGNMLETISSAQKP